MDLLLPLAALIACPSLGTRLAPAPSAASPIHTKIATKASKKEAKKRPSIVVLPIQPAYEWTGYGGNASHTALSQVTSKSLGHILWSTPVDAANYNGNEILVHYGEAGVTALNDVVVPLRGTNGYPYTVRGFQGTTGTLLWSYTSTYIEPQHDWVPSFGPSLLPGLAYNAHIFGSSAVIPYSPQVAWPESGGRIAVRNNSDFSTGTVAIHAFYGDALYAANSAAFDAGLKVCTPLTVGSDGSVYFGFVIESSVPGNLQNGLAVIHPNGTGTWVSATALSGGDTSTNAIPLNCAPAISADGSRVYIETATTASGWGRGYLCSAAISTLTPMNHVALMDPLTPGNWATTLGDSTASPMCGPDGDVYMGVLENPFLSNDDRGWMLHFSEDLKTTKIPGAFGWDDTASIVPASAVPSYSGSSKYLICTKYNDYADFGTQPGNNKVAILDPNATEVDSISGATTMNEVITVLGVTFNTELNKGVREWCVNSVTIDPIGKRAILNSEDGTAYIWDFTTNSLTQKLSLTPGIGEAYTPTIVGPNGTIYCVNNATFYAIGP